MSQVHAGEDMDIEGESKVDIAEQDTQNVCSCGSDDISHDDSGGIHYSICRTCWKEDYKGEDVVDYRNGNMEEEDDPFLNKNSGEVMQLATNEEPVNDLSCLSAGDHIMWRRPYVVCHHAIVTKPNNNDELKVIHWARTDDCCSRFTIEISEKIIHPHKDTEGLHIVKYDNTIESKNPPYLVEMRARALIGLKNYNFLHRNCEKFARFCKTGVNFNLQYPWLMRKLDQTATSTIIKSMTFLIFADFVNVDWGVNFYIYGSTVIIILEIISLITDIVNAYFLYKYPTTYLQSKRDFKEMIKMRTLESVFGAAGMIGGFIMSEVLCRRIGHIICPGNGTWLGYAFGGLFFGIFGGFVFGVLFKALGNAVWICMSTKSTCCISSPDESTNKTNVSLDAEGKIKKRKMVRRYLARSKIAQGGLMLIVFGFILLVGCFKQYFKVYNDFLEARRTTCVTQEISYLRKDYPCPVVHIKLNNQPGRDILPVNQSVLSHDDRTQIFENERVFHQGTCSFQPRCRENDRKTNIEMNEYIDRFGKPGTNFSCLYHPKNMSMVIRKRESFKLSIPMGISFFALLLFGSVLITYSVCKERKTSTEHPDSLYIVVIAVLGLTSYLYALRWFSKLVIKRWLSYCIVSFIAAGMRRIYNNN